MQGGQVGVETIIAAAIVLGIVATIVSMATLYNTESNAASKGWALLNECERVSGAISGVYASGSGTSWQGSTDYNLFFGPAAVAVGESGKPIGEGEFCMHSAVLGGPNVYITGTFTVENRRGLVFVG